MKYILPKIFILILIVVSVGRDAFAQDVHFSQFDAAPLYFNPSQSGLFDCNRRVVSNFKGQWSTYNSFMASYDQPVPQIQVLGATLGAGGLLNVDKGGENSYGNTQFRLIPALHKDIIPGTFKLSAGLDILMNINSIDETTVILPGSVDPYTGSSTAGVDLLNPTRFYMDLGLGFNGQYRLNENTPINAGITFYRLFGSGGGGIVSNDAQPNYRRFSLNANAIIPFVPGFINFLPSFIYLNQKKYNELNVGTYAQFIVGNYTAYVDALYAGMWYRYGDALILGFAFDKPLNSKVTMNFGFSYDITVSALNRSDKWAATKNVGTDSFEFSLKFIWCQAPIIVKPEGIINDPFR